MPAALLFEDLLILRLLLRGQNGHNPLPLHLPDGLEFRLHLVVELFTQLVETLP